LQQEELNELVTRFRVDYQEERYLGKEGITAHNSQLRIHIQFGLVIGNQLHWMQLELERRQTDGAQSAQPPSCHCVGELEFR
jgi:hypothetical protein